MDIKDLIANKIRLLRDNHNMSQEELAYNLNLHPGSISKIETSKVCITLPTILKICELYNLTLRDFFNFDVPVFDSHTKSIIAEINSELQEKNIEQLKTIFTIVKAIK